MKAFIAVCVLGVVAVALARPETYDAKYDGVNVLEILENPRLFEVYFGCIMDTVTKCPPEAKELKSHIAEALENGCENCTDKQKEGVKTVIGHLINHKADSWDQLKAKYDPENKYTKKYEKELKEIKA